MVRTLLSRRDGSDATAPDESNGIPPGRSGMDALVRKLLLVVVLGVVVYLAVRRGESE